MKYLFLIVALAGCGKVAKEFDRSKIDLAKRAVTKFADESYPRWALANVQSPCPPDLLALAKYMGQSEADTKDPWGTPYKLFCGSTMPAGAGDGVAVISFGPDKAEGTADDVKSW